MRNQLTLVAGILVWGGVTSSHADTTLSHTHMMSKEPSTVWTSGVKQRKEMNMPIVGKQVVVTRVDKGVEWTINSKKKTYTEKALALPYTPMPTSKESDESKPTSKGDESKEAEPTCTPAMTKLPGARTIAGLPASGYKMGCKENPKEGMTVWQAAPTASTKQADQDIKTFAKAHTKAQFANYPAKERAEIEKGFSQWANIISALPSMIGTQKMPEGFLVAMEMESEGDKQTLYELTALSTNPIPADNFEIPAGYKKVAPKPGGFDDMGGMNMNDALKELGNWAPKN